MCPLFDNSFPSENVDFPFLFLLRKVLGSLSSQKCNSTTLLSFFCQFKCIIKNSEKSKILIIHKIWKIMDFTYPFILLSDLNSQKKKVFPFCTIFDGIEWLLKVHNEGNRISIIEKKIFFWSFRRFFKSHDGKKVISTSRTYLIGAPYFPFYRQRHQNE